MDCMLTHGWNVLYVKYIMQLAFSQVDDYMVLFPDYHVTCTHDQYGAQSTLLIDYTSCMYEYIYVHV